MKLLYRLCIFICCSQSLFAQEYLITGAVTGTTRAPLEEVLLTAFDAQSNTYLKHTYSDASGTYRFTFSDTNPVYIKADALGFKSYKSDHLVPGQDIPHLITLAPLEEELDEIVILQKKKIVSLKGDKLIYDVEQSGIGDGNSGLEVISKMPGIRLDKDENIVFRGTPNMQVMINGKRSLLKGEQLTQFLKSIGGENIKSIEIIANPSARYDAEGVAGVIDIKLKKSYQQGFTGNINTSLGYGEFHKGSIGVNLYQHTKKWSFNASAKYGNYNSVNHREILQDIHDGQNTTRLDQSNDWFPKSSNTTFSLGTEYAINDNSAIGSSWNYNNYISDETTEGRTNEFINQEFIRYTTLNIEGDIRNHDITGNLYYNFTSDSLDTELNVQLNYAHYNNSKSRTTLNRYFNAIDNTTYQNDFELFQNNPAQYDIFTSQIDYKKNFLKKFTLELGAKYSYVHNDYDNQYQILADDPSNMTDIPNNHLLYSESIGAAYGILSWNTDRWNIQGGLRSEYIDYKTTSVTGGITATDNYIAFFPSLNISHSLDKHSFQASYSRRINRPRYLDLNPFYEYIDTYNVSLGNPNLQPQFSNAFQLTYVYNQTTSISGYANFSNDVIYNVIRYDQELDITTIFQDNIASSITTGASFSTTVDLFAWWNINLNANAYYNRITSEIPSLTFDNKGYGGNAGITNTHKLKNDWTLSWDTFYDIGGVYGNYDTRPSYDLSLSLKKWFLDKKLKVQFKANNVLNRSFFRSSITQNNATTHWVNKWEARRFYLTATYNFGSGKKKRVKQGNLNDEINRL